MKILLAHGILGFGRLGLLPNLVNYFNGVAAHLTAKGHDVSQPQVNPIGSVHQRGEQLAKRILAIELGPNEKLHVIAHSMGGLDMRYALNVPGVRERVATLVTIGTPHNGSPVADAIAQQAGPLFDHCPPFLRAQLQFNAGGLHDLTTDAAKEFNSDTRAEGVRCIAVAGNAALAGHELLLFQFAAIVAHETGEENDGVVTRSSAVRPGYEHLPAADWPTDHAGEIGWTLPLPWKVPFLPGAPAPHLARYDDIVSRL